MVDIKEIVCREKSFISEAEYYSNKYQIPVNFECGDILNSDKCSNYYDNVVYALNSIKLGYITYQSLVSGVKTVRSTVQSPTKIGQKLWPKTLAKRIGQQIWPTKIGQQIGQQKLANKNWPTKNWPNKIAK